jgi:hypothetical protein
LLLPLAAMQFTDEVNWSASDFLFAALLAGGAGVVFDLVVRRSPNRAYRAGVGFGLAATVLIIWANGAVGMIGSEENPLNLMFAGVLVLALTGAVLARFRASGMARGMTVAAIAHLLACGLGLPADPHGAILSAGFATLWVLSAISFSKAACGATQARAARND